MHIFVGRIGQDVISLTILSQFSNDLVIRPNAGTDYPSVDRSYLHIALIADGPIGPTVIRSYVQLQNLRVGLPFWAENKATGLSRTLVVALVLLAFSGCSRSANTTTLDQIRAAEQEFANATEGEQFRLSAQRYQQVTDGGFVSGRSLYNQGNAYLKSNQRGRAIASYRLAMRYLPRDPKLAANLESALGKPLEGSTKHILLDYVFVWQRWLSYREKFQLTTFLLVAALALLWYSRWHAKSVTPRRIAMVTGALSLVFAASAALDWYRYEWQRHGVLVEQMMPRKGNSQNYEPAFTKPLSDGTEFVVLERRGDWLRATFGDNAEGWVPVDAAVIY